MKSLLFMSVSPLCLERFCAMAKRLHSGAGSKSSGENFYGIRNRVIIDETKKMADIVSFNARGAEAAQTDESP